MKLLPFDLEKALKGAKVVTRDGREVGLSAFHVGEQEYPLCGNVSGEHSSRWWTATGCQYNRGLQDRPSILDADLFLAVELIVRWVNFYPVANRATYFDSEQLADQDHAHGHFYGQRNEIIPRLYGRAIRVEIDPDGAA